MPSKFEPCGLTQMYAQRYGTLPIARNTGGLKDTVVAIDLEAKRPKGTGILFEGESAGELVDAVSRSLAFFANKSALKKIQRNGMRVNFFWRKSAKTYNKIHKKIVRT